MASQRGRIESEHSGPLDSLRRLVHADCKALVRLADPQETNVKQKLQLPAYQVSDFIPSASESDFPVSPLSTHCGLSRNPGSVVALQRSGSKALYVDKQRSLAADPPAGVAVVSRCAPSRSEIPATLATLPWNGSSLAGSVCSLEISRPRALRLQSEE